MNGQDLALTKKLIDKYGGGTVSDSQLHSAIDKKIADGTIASGGQLESKANKTYVLSETKNDIKPLYINTFDGSSDALHPAVVYFDTKWNGYKYWMAYTPLSGKTTYVDRYECPCIAVSNDGRVWQTPRGLTNPLDDLTPEQIANTDWFSDPCILYDDIKNRLEIYYRYTNRNAPKMTITYRRYTTDGINWSARETIYDPSVSAISPNECLSPNVIKINNKYQLYYMAGYELIRVEKDNDLGGGLPNATPCYLESVDGVNKPWHVGMYYEKETSTYHLLGFEGRNIAPKGNIHYYTSKDGINFKFQGVSISYDSNNKGYIRDLYQTIPVKVGNKWLVYATVRVGGTSKEWDAGGNSICLFQGDNLLELSHIKGEFSYNRPVYYNDILLANNDKPNQPRLGLRYLVYESADCSIKYGYGIDMTTKAPTWARGNEYKNDNIMTTIYDVSNPTIKPMYVGQFWVNTTNKRVFIGTATTSITDFLEITTGLAELTRFVNNGVVINKSLKGDKCKPIIDASNIYNITITGVENGNIIENVTGGVDRQEIVIFNVMGNSMTLKNNANSNEGFMYLKGLVDRELKAKESIKLIKYGNYWYEN